MLFRILHDEASGVLSYLLGDEATREAVLIDPRSSDRVVLDAVLHAERLKLRWILRTHDHEGAQPHEARRLLAWRVPLVQGRERTGVTVPSATPIWRAWPRKCVASAAQATAARSLRPGE
ncbi:MULTISPECIES: hypothetical protein [unclassified Tepidimonas]|uniref:hypothetical protein n=1 Tax=unclassified Tepidimonas TaxID=2631705 RepID=UPI003C7B9562